MTYPAASRPSCLPEITPQLVLHSGAGAEITCHWCKKIMAACDGVAPLSEVARRTHLPLKTCLKLVERALAQGWFEVAALNQPPAAPLPAAPSAGFWADLRACLQAALGEAGQELLTQAIQMTRQQPASLTPRDYASVLLALELAASGGQREPLLPRLDALRQQYAVS